MADEIKSDRIRPASAPAHVERDTADDRAQPGDVLGVERDGERTHLDETAEDEDARREEAEKADRHRGR